MDSGFVEYCLNVGAFSKDALNDVLLRVREGTSLYEAVIRAKLVLQEDLAIIAGEYYHAPVVDLSKIKPESKAIAYGSLNDCKRLMFMPFGVDPVVGLLVAIADFAEIKPIQALLQTLHVERIKFYIAPFDTLSKMIELVYDQIDPNLSLTSRLKRNASLLKTQATEIDFSNAKKKKTQDAFQVQGIDIRRLQVLSLELADCREENKVLRQRVEQLNATLELESEMIRELVKILRANGTLDDRSFEQWLLAQR